MERLGYRPALDGVRAVAIVGVVASHAYGRPLGGAFGVDLFFVLSGFLITTLLREEHERAGSLNLPHFYRRRARRLLPPLAVMLTVYSIVTLLTRWETEGRLLTGVGATVGYASNFTMAYAIDRMPQGLSHTWSLAAEEQFYLLWPVLLLLLLRRKRRLAIALLVASILLVDANYLWRADQFGNGIAFSPEYRSTIALLCGCLFALIPASTGFRQTVHLLRPLTASIVALAFLMELRPTFGTLHLVFCLAAAALLAGLLEPGPITTFFGWAPFAWLGRVSYSLYLWHVPVLYFLATHGAINPLIGIAVSLAAATASYYLVERRFVARRTLVPALAPAV